jgi:hypothetical protein
MRETDDVFGLPCQSFVIMLLSGYGVTLLNLKRVRELKRVLNELDINMKRQPDGHSEHRKK